ncbi:MAG: adenosylcobinamide-phosphate synthase CbiB [Anaerolineae bacterium]|nr:adenosylcobinamide-phosphate synthase CbiB [Anaerolineae bacterium]
MIILITWLLDLWLGEPPVRLHPVIWMGNYLRYARKKLPPTFLAGTAAWLGGAIIVFWITLLLPQIFPFTFYIFNLLATAILLKPLIAWRALREAAAEVMTAPDLPAMRKMLSWHLVSRNTSDLSEAEVCGATIESVAENLSDSLIAPLFWFVIGQLVGGPDLPLGLAFAALYRYTNTADAMWGYRTPELEYFGKWTARLDDMLNLIPSRLTALLICVCSGNARSWQIWWRDGLSTPSPNAGQPMSAAAGALGVRLTKRNLYNLGRELPDPQKADITRAIALCARAAWVGVLVLIAALHFIY